MKGSSIVRKYLMGEGGINWLLVVLGTTKRSKRIIDTMLVQIKMKLSHLSKGISSKIVFGGRRWHLLSSCCIWYCKEAKVAGFLIQCMFISKWMSHTAPIYFAATQVFAWCTAKGNKQEEESQLNKQKRKKEVDSRLSTGATSLGTDHHIALQNDGEEGSSFFSGGQQLLGCKLCSFAQLILEQE
jgi:hypothetical protein